MRVKFKQSIFVILAVTSVNLTILFVLNTKNEVCKELKVSSLMSPYETQIQTKKSTITTTSTTTIKVITTVISNVSKIKRSYVHYDQLESLLQKTENQINENQSVLFSQPSCNIKYLVFECLKPICGGWADRLKGIMSAYIWSLITKREFIIDIKHPCLLQNMLLPNKIKWNETNNCKYYINNETNYFSYSNNRSLYKISYLNKVSNAKFHKLLQYLDIKSYKSDSKVLIIHNNLDWIKSFSLNQYLLSDVSKLGYKANRFKLQYIFRDLYKKLFKLTPKLEVKFNKFKAKAKPNNLTRLICVQVRIGGQRPNVAFDKQFTERNNSKLYWDFVRSTLLTHHDSLNKNPSNASKAYFNGKTNYKIFITTDTESVEQEAIQVFGKNMIVTNEGPFTHIDREQVISLDNCERVEKAILDFHSLQLCDAAVISESGFGILGVFNRKDPIKDLYRFESIKDESSNIIDDSHEIYHNKYVFRKIVNLDQFDE